MRGLSQSTKELIRYAFSLLKADHPQTLRQLHYAIFSRKEVPYENNQRGYKRLSRTTTVARRMYRDWELTGRIGPVPADGIPPRWLVDETRQPEMPSVWKDAEEYIETVKVGYRRDNWQDQPNHCEVWSEKATILGAIRRTADELGVTTRVSHGFGSTGMETQVGQLFEGIDKPITVFYLGDHDPSGRVIEEDLHRRIQVASGAPFRMVRLAIHQGDIEKFNLPPQRIKASDSRSSEFRRRFGLDAPTVELDALPAQELRRRIEEAVSGLIDFELWDRQLAVQEEELKCIAEFAERIKKLPRNGTQRTAKPGEEMSSGPNLDALLATLDQDGDGN